MHLKSIKSILVVCTGNICRSPMGEGVLRSKLDKAGLSYIKVDSAGTSGWDNESPTPEAVSACLEIGVDISGLRSAPISGRMIQEADLILAMEKYHVDEMKKLYDAPDDKIFLMGDFNDENPGMEIDDPYAKSMSYYRRVLENICGCADGFVSRLK